MMTRVAALFLIVLAAAQAGAVFAAERRVYVNDVRLAPKTVLALEVGYKTSIPNGRYWYDRHSGLWGRQGGPALGKIRAGLELGGRLQKQASNGDTAVYVNGRRLPRMELHALQQLVGRVQPPAAIGWIPKATPASKVARRW